MRQEKNGSHWRCDGSMVGNVLIWPVLTFSSIFLYDWNENCWFDALFLLMGYGVSGAYLTVKELDTMKSLTHKMYPQIFFYDEAHSICDDDVPSDVPRDVPIDLLSVMQRCMYVYDVSSNVHPESCVYAWWILVDGTVV